MNHLFVWLNLNFLHVSLATQSFVICCIRLFRDWRFRLSHHIIIIIIYRSNIIIINDDVDFGGLLFHIFFYKIWLFRNEL